jgi:CRISPR-associated protein Cas5h
MRVVRFRYRGRVGHFLRAEMNASALSYPVPPRTALLGLLGNVLGLAKDSAPDVLREAAVAVGGKIPRKHYHRANVRKAFPPALSLWIKPAKTGQALPDDPGSGFASQVVQEWLVDPDFAVYVGALGEPAWMTDLEARLAANRTHYSPCLGPAWMLARLELEASGEGRPLPEGIHDVATVCRRSDNNSLALDRLKDRKGHAVQEVRMPREVTADRVFSHANYYLEMNGRPMPIRTATAWSFHEEAIVFL